MSIWSRRCFLVLTPLATVALIAAGSAVNALPQAGEGLGQPPLGLDLYVPIPPGNPPTAAAIALGKRLFVDSLLSADSKVSCSSCHRPAHGFASTGATSRGVFGHRTKRNAPSLLNAAYGKFFFWDGRTRTLEEQVIQPIVNPDEMGLTLDEMAERIDAQPAYTKAFKEVFGDGPAAVHTARALASYVRTLRSGNSAADRYAAGNMSALNADARAGLKLFREKANCVQCHLGPLLTDERFHNTGVGWGGHDAGRFDVTGDERDRGKFNTPSLRNVALTMPYMHDGSIRTLEEVIEFYDRGANPNPNLDPEIQPLGLTRSEKKHLAVYLRALTGSRLE